jgi:hypothetical protein
VAISNVIIVNNNRPNNNFLSSSTTSESGDLCRIKKPVFRLSQIKAQDDDHQKYSDDITSLPRFSFHIGNLKTASSSELSSRMGVLLSSLCLCIFFPNLLPRYKAEGGEDRKKPTLSAATLQNLSPSNQPIANLN